MPCILSSVGLQPSASAIARRQTAAKPLLRQRQPGLAALTARPSATVSQGTRRTAVHVSAAASTDKAEPEHPYFSDEWKEYNRRFQRPVRRPPGVAYSTTLSVATQGAAGSTFA